MSAHLDVCSPHLRTCHVRWRQEDSPPWDDLYSALRDIVYRPVKPLVPPWSWKAAALSALLRGIAFFVANLRSGHQHALQAMMVEAIFAIFAAGLIGAVSQRLRASQPVREAAAIVCLGLPALMVMAQLGVHRAAHTPRGSWSACILLLRSHFLGVQLVSASATPSTVPDGSGR
jgi:hypothetical protein